MSIIKLPYKLVLYIVQYLNLEDHFQYLVHEENIVKTILNKKAPASKRYSPELKQLFKRREAVSLVSPYLATIIAVVKTWLFKNRLRILNLHYSVSSEIVVNIRPLLNEAIIKSRASRNYKFQLLYYAHDILVVFNACENRILTAPRLASGYKIFVRNNDKFLYYKTYIDFSGNDFRPNILKIAGFNIRFIICFEIIDGYFYGLSNRTSFEVTGIDLTSYYVCFRFPLSRRGFYEIKQAAQSRKEWLVRHGSARRTYYTTEISFKGALRETEWEYEDNDGFASDEDGWDPYLVHPVMLTLSQCPTFLDVVNDTSSFNSNRQHIRIRGGSRRRWSPDELQKRRRDPESVFKQMIHDLYKHEDVALWPPEQDPVRPDPALDELYTLLSPPGHRGNVHGTWDDRCLVYATGGTSGGLKAIILVSFDPSIRLIGARPYSGRLILGRPAGRPHCGPGTSSKLYPTDPESDPELSYEGKGKGKEKDKNDAWNPTSEPNATWHAEMRPPESDSGTTQLCPTDPEPDPEQSYDEGGWRSFEKAMYRDISRAIHFGI
ncbi:hypothetical protein QBC46DRAFT_368035 [Diplogelasinospora grovesii]|uniref:F-box domain-containing protein n=1 Tax=Diplogelasinospora grovesii TaxID=303347 RepID=A0AAN6RYN0_9PEZI|nr:hypothetical protein QBC46DRAFT_368035 [Diplogelasinospora grovesii]